MSRQNSNEVPRQFKVSRKDLPLACPNQLVGAWIAHPRVFMRFQDGRAVCPYCSTEYLLEDSG